MDFTRRVIVIIACLAGLALTHLPFRRTPLGTEKSTA